MSANAARPNLLWRCFALAFAYAVFWALVHFTVTKLTLNFWWILPQIAASTLVFFTLNGLFASFDGYRFGLPFRLLIASFYLHPFFHALYYLTYRNFLEQQNISLLLREPFFLVKVFSTEMRWWSWLAFFAGIAFFHALNRYFLSRPARPTGFRRPYDFFLNKWSLLFTALMIGLQIKWCLDNDTSQMVMRPLYPIVLMGLVSIFVHLLRSSAPLWERVLAGLLVVVSVSHFYALNLGFVDSRRRFTLDHQYYRSLFGAFFVQAAFGDMKQDDGARELFRELPPAQIDYNILVILNDTQRWDKLSSNGFEKPTDDEMDWFLSKSFKFRFPVAPANFTDTAVPPLLSGLASDQDVKRIKGSLPFWDYFAKTAETFFISSQDVTWSKLHLFYASIGQKHVWSATAQPSYGGRNPEDVDDILSYDYISAYLPKLKSPWVGVWQTFAPHFPYTVGPEAVRYRPCVLDREKNLEHFLNCYLNTMVYSAQLRSRLLKQLDLENTVVLLTSDHGEGLGEHGIFFHGVDYHQEMVKVPFDLYIPKRLLDRIPAENLRNLKENVNRITSTTDLVPTLVHLHELVTGQKLYRDFADYSGKSLFTHWDHRVVFSSHCFPQYRCYSREIMFADDNYYVLFRPAEGFHRIYETWKDLKQERPLTFDQIDKTKFEALIDEAARVHGAGQSMKAYYGQLKANGYRAL